MSRTWVVSVLTAIFAGSLSAGEIIVAPQQAGTGGSRSASEQRDRARAYQSEAPAGSTILVLPEEEGVLSPRNGGAEGRAYDNRNRARQMQGGKDSSDIEFVVPGSGSDANTTRNKASELRSRAAGYSRGETHTATGGKANDGIPVIVCKDTESVAGRIGDDAVSGGILIIMRDGKPMKVRCQ